MFYSENSATVTGNTGENMYSSTCRVPSIFSNRNENFNALNAELNPICHLLALLGAHLILHVSRVRVNLCIQCVMSKISTGINIPLYVKVKE
jgi:hypothetical protein